MCGLAMIAELQRELDNAKREVRNRELGIVLVAAAAVLAYFIGAYSHGRRRVSGQYEDT